MCFFVSPSNEPIVASKRDNNEGNSTMNNRGKKPPFKHESGGYHEEPYFYLDLYMRDASLRVLEDL